MIAIYQHDTFPEMGHHLDRNRLPQLPQFEYNHCQPPNVNAQLLWHMSTGIHVSVCGS